MSTSGGPQPLAYPAVAPAPGALFEPLPGAELGTAAPANSGATGGPFYLPGPIALAALSCWVTTAGDTGSMVRCALYADTGQGAPGSLVVDAGDVSAEATGLATGTLADAVNLGPGWYWTMCRSNDDPTGSIAVESYVVPPRNFPLPGVYVSWVDYSTAATQGVLGVGGAMDPGKYPATFPALVPVTNWPRVLLTAAG